MQRGSALQMVRINWLAGLVASTPPSSAQFDRRGFGLMQPDGRYRACTPDTTCLGDGMTLYELVTPRLEKKMDASF